MSKQFTIIISDKILQTNLKIKNKQTQKITEKSKTYLKTKNNSILLKPPNASKLRGYQADVVINETGQIEMSNIAAKPGGIIINLKEDEQETTSTETKR